MKNRFTIRALYGSTAALASTMVATAAHAEAAANPIVTLIESVDLSTVSIAIAAVALLIVGIALTFKGPDVAKRVIRKV